jgi:hypothetical protein
MGWERGFERLRFVSGEIFRWVVRFCTARVAIIRKAFCRRHVGVWYMTRGAEQCPNIITKALNTPWFRTSTSPDILRRPDCFDVSLIVEWS